MPFGQLNAGDGPARVYDAVCPEGSLVHAPWSLAFFDSLRQEVTHVEYVDCDGYRLWPRPFPQGDIPKYLAYGKGLLDDNEPTVVADARHNITITLVSPAPVEVREGITGRLLWTFPMEGAPQRSYQLLRADAEEFVNHPLVFDVISPSDSVCHGTATVILRQ
jgi:hypothetical protein